MANSGYGTVRPANFSPIDADVLYTYQESRYVEGDGILRTLDSVDVLIPQQVRFEDTEVPEGEELDNIGGMYKLKLPQTEFSETGIYNVYIRPKEINTVITDCGVLDSLPNIKGIVLDLESDELEGFDNFDGYRVEYFDELTGAKEQNFFRIVVSSLRVEAVSGNISSNVSQKTVKYRINENGTLIFLTLTPSVNNIDENISTSPFIGNPNQKIVLSNTFFDPLTVEVELVNEDLETLSYALYNNQIKRVGDGKYFIYTPSGDVYKAYNLYEAVNEFGETVVEFREETTDIDNETDNFDAIKNDELS